MIIICYFVLVAIGSQFVNNKSFRLYGLACAILIGYISYHIVPLETSDLSRHLQEINYYRTYGWEWVSLGNRTDGNIGSVVVFYLMSFLPDNQLFPAIVASLSYWLLFDLIFLVREDNDYSHRWVAGTILFVGLSFNYYLLIYAVRLWVVFSIFVYCLYQEFVRKKHRVACWCVYVCLVLFHYAAISLVGIRIAASLVLNPKSRGAFFARCFLLLLSILGMYYIMQSSVGSLLLRKMERYSMYSIRGTWQTISCWGRAICVFLVAVFQLRESDSENTKFYCMFISGIVSFMLLQYGNYQVTLRFADCLVVSVIPLLPQIINNKEAPKFCVTYSQLFSIMVIIISVTYVVLFDYRNLLFAF